MLFHVCFDFLGAHKTHGTCLLLNPLSLDVCSYAMALAMVGLVNQEVISRPPCVFLLKFILL